MSRMPARSLWAAAALILGAAAMARGDGPKSYGTGFVVDQRGYILTNEHVVHRAKTVNVVFSGREVLPATILSTDPEHDLALLKVEAQRPLPIIPIGTSAEVKRQQRVLAMGFPFGEDAITSTSGRIVSVRKEGASQLIVTDAVVNPGNSGGPLLNDHGEAVGVIRSLLLAEVGGVRVKAGEIYAIPISFALPMMAAIPGYDFSGVGRARGRLELDELDAGASPAVVQILSDRVKPGTIDGAAGEGVSEFGKNAVALLTSYLDRMDVEYAVDPKAERPFIRTQFKMDNAVHHPCIVVDDKRQLVYLFLNRYLSAPPDHPRLPEITRALMEYNWRVNLGKFEWDKSDGEIRYSYVFTTENGLGFEAFEAIYYALLKLGDSLWPELTKLTQTGEAEQETD